MGDIATLVIRLVGDTTGLSGEVKKAGAEINSLDQTLGRAGKTLAGFFTVTAVIGFTQGIMDAAGALVDLSEATGHSIEELQRMQFVAEQTGSSLDAYTAASSRLSVALGKNSEDTQKALADLGLQGDALRNMNQDERFRAVAEALHDVTDQTRFAADAQALYGKGFKEIKPGIVEGYAEIAKAATVASEEQVRSVEAAGDALDKFKRSLKTEATTLLGNAVLAGQGLADSSWSERISTIWTALNAPGKAGADPITNLLDSLATKGRAAAEAQAAIATENGKVTESLRIEGEGIGDLVKEYDALIKIQDQLFGTEAIEHANQMVEAWKMAGDAARLTRQGHADLLTALVDEAAKYVEIGKAGTKAYTDVLAKIKELKDYQFPILPSSNLPTRGLMGGPGDLTGQEVSPEARDLAAQKQDVDNLTATWEDYAETIRKVSDENDARIAQSVSVLHTAADEQNATLGGMTNRWQVLGNAAREAGNLLKAAVPRDFDYAAAYAASGRVIHGSLAGLGVYAPPNFTMPGFATGTSGYEDFGSGTPVMLHGREKVTPWGADEGGGSVVTVNMSGVLLSDSPAGKEAIRRVVDDAITSSIKRSRKFSY